MNETVAALVKQRVDQLEEVLSHVKLRRAEIESDLEKNTEHLAKVRAQLAELVQFARDNPVNLPLAEGA